ncbi:2Fe-2S iron-sulfur cluster-binding protein [Paenibacillus sp. HJGM_3]|uniref:2Fe-2S iron-sulfur cluster-binding protein n=1 Tax=Paenibacillus sp. HJGM_3 TaxID=3379816 RepID=UPI00385F4DD3
MLELKGRSKRMTVEPVPGRTILELAMKHGVDWGFNCTRGTCARCRCLVVEGRAALMPPTEAEELRLEPEELEQGYRLGCQTRIERPDAHFVVALKPYF